jgi:polyisoprenyl-phosphate glycosyltransferase
VAHDNISVVVPVYKNTENVAPLLTALAALNEELQGALEAVFVVDGSPDDSYLRLATGLPACTFRWQLLQLSRNFGSFAAIRAGLEVAEGPYFAVMAADLQEPPSLVVQFRELLKTGNYDVTIGERTGRDDPFAAKFAATTFWGLYRRLILPEIPPGGVDVFGCNTLVRDQLIQLRENHSSLVGLLFWVGFRRQLVPYKRRQREGGSSAWTLRKKIQYLVDSVFSFSDLPIRILSRLGLLGLLFSCGLAAAVFVARVTDAIPVPGYATTIIVVSFFGGLNCFGLGIIGSYVWRTYENTKGRPNYIVLSRQKQKE